MRKQLSAAARESRLRLDERTMALINIDPAPIRVSGHRNAPDAKTGANAIVPGSGPVPEHYRVIYGFDTLSGPGIRQKPTVVHIDLLANGNYPFSEPVCRTVGKVTPWTPHFHHVYPVCIGAGWPQQASTEAGRSLAVDLVLHIAKLLNFDEPAPKPGYHGYNEAAIDWWRTEHGCRPLNPALRYPNIDPNAAVGQAGERFQAAVSRPPGAGRFALAARGATAGGRFTAIGGAS